MISFGKTFIASVSDMVEIRKAIKSAFIMDLFIAMENGEYFIADIKGEVHSALYTRRNRKSRPRDFDRDPSSQLALTGGVLECPVRSTGVTGVKLT